MPFRPLEHWLQRVRNLVTLATPEAILETACHEARRVMQCEWAYASCVRANERWENGLHVEDHGAGTRTASPAVRSALFAVHRALSRAREPVELRRSEETATMFAALARDTGASTMWAIPILQGKRRLWGALVLVEPRTDEGNSWRAAIEALAELTTAALENAQRLAYARRDQDRLLLISEATSDALYDWNFDTREFWWGGGILKLVGEGADRVETTPRWKLERVHVDDRERVRTSLEAARFSKVSTWTCEYRFGKADGTYIDVEDRGYFQRGTDGRAYRMIGSLQDVTARKELLAREQQARREAEAASRAKDEFLALLGHELRNPLAPIVSGLQLLRIRGGGKELDVMERQAKHLVRLVDDLLDISRITHGKIELKPESADLGGLIAAAVETVTPVIAARNHRLDMTGVECGIMITGDRARLTQAISNLLANAAKYTEPHGVITIRTDREADMVAVSVRDTGIGIDAEMLPSIFNMFVQEKQALDRAQGGLGLGLTIVRSMVELHGGTVEARSEGRGRGSELIIRLPLGQAAAELRRSAPVIKEPPSLGRRILVVDDNADAADLLSVLLERLGNTTRVAHDARAALELVDDFAPDLAVLDIGLPDIDGYELARQLRARPSTHAMRLIALSGYGQASDRERSAGAGFDAHLVKPVGVDALKACIEKIGSGS